MRSEHLHELSKHLERFLRSFGDLEQSRDWLSTLVVYGHLLGGSPKAWAETSELLDAFAADATEIAEIRPWTLHPEICVAMQSAHHCGLALVQAIWNATGPRAPVLGIDATDSQVSEYMARNRDILIDAFTKLAGQADYAEWLRLAAAVGIEQAKMGTDQHTDTLVTTDTQAAILKALNGRALKLEPLAVLVSNGDTSRLYRPGGLRELREAGLVKHRRGVGFYLPICNTAKKLAVILP